MGGWKVDKNCKFYKICNWKWIREKMNSRKNGTKEWHNIVLYKFKSTSHTLIFLKGIPYYGSTNLLGVQFLPL